MHILQSNTWQDFENSLDEQTFTDHGEGWSYLASLKSTHLGSYLFVQRGPSLSSSSALRPSLNSLETLAKRTHAFFVRIEPELSTPDLKNLRKVKSVNPEHTWILDLSPDKSDLLSGFSQGTRTRYNTYSKKGLSVTTSKDPSDIKFLVDLQQKVAFEKRFTPFSEEYLKRELEQPFSTLYLVHFEGKVIAASLMFDYYDTRYYMQSASDPTCRKLPATVALLCTAMFDAKDKGLKFFDFWGIAPSEDPEHPWYGFTKFKKSFGGELLTYPGTYDFIINKPKYQLYTVLRRANLSKAMATASLRRLSWFT